MILGLVLLAALLAVLGYAATRPAQFRVERSLGIAAPPARIFPLVDDLRRHVEWSSWERKDPGMTRRYEGASAGTGAVYEWAGNRQIGRGRMAVIESIAPEKVVFAMHFIAPFEARSTAEILLEPEGGSTRVTWALYGPRTFPARLLSLFCSAERMIGREFAAGLASLKALVETRLDPASAAVAVPEK